MRAYLLEDIYLVLVNQSSISVQFAREASCCSGHEREPQTAGAGVPHTLPCKFYKILHLYSVYFSMTLEKVLRIKIIKY